MSLKTFLIVGVHKKALEWLSANEFLSNSKNYLRFSCVSITNEFFEHLSMKKDPLNQIIRKWPPEGVFADFLDIFRYERWFMKKCRRMVLNFCELF